MGSVGTWRECQAKGTTRVKALWQCGWSSVSEEERGSRDGRGSGGQCKDCSLDSKRGGSHWKILSREVT